MDKISTLNTTYTEDVTILVPDLTFDKDYQDEQALYAVYDFYHFTPNPFNDLYKFFAAQVAPNFPNMGIDFQIYWRNKAYKYPQLSLELKENVPQFEELTESIGTLFYYYDIETSSDNESVANLVTFSYSPVLYPKLYDFDPEVVNLFVDGLDKVNNLMVENSEDLLFDDLKDTANAEIMFNAIDIMYEKLYSQYGDLMKLLPIINQFYGDVVVEKNVYPITIEDANSICDPSLNKIESKFKILTMQTLDAELTV